MFSVPKDRATTGKDSKSLLAETLFSSYFTEIGDFMGFSREIRCFSLFLVTFKAIFSSIVDCDGVFCFCKDFL